MSIEPNTHHQYFHSVPHKLATVTHKKGNGAQIHENTTPSNSGDLCLGTGAPKHF